MFYNTMFCEEGSLRRVLPSDCYVSIGVDVEAILRSNPTVSRTWASRRI